MTRKVNVFWILYGMVLTVLFLLSSTDLIIKEEAAEIYPVSVIIGDASDEHYVNFRKGMERAAVELNADVSFITLYEEGSEKQQRELILREQEDGSRALVVDPVESGWLVQMQKDRQISVPLILLNGERSEAAELERGTCITFDYHAMGRKLGEEILKAHTAGERICLLEGENPDMAERLFTRGLSEILTEAGSSERALQIPGGKDMGALLKNALGEEGKAVIAALSPGSLMQAAQLLSEEEETEKRVEGLYGRGNTVSLLNYLDKGVIAGICVTDDFSAGYLSVKAAVDLAENRSVRDMGYLESYYIRREDLRNEKYEKMLYPVE